MKSYRGYHANEECIIERSCKSGQYHYARGNSQWLGNGIYFFEDTPEKNGLKHAKAWNKKQSHSNPAILCADINVNLDCLCDLEDEKTRNIINSLKDEFMMKMLILVKKKPKNGYIDGIFFNMWDTFIKNKKIHVIRKHQYYQTVTDQTLGIKSGIPNVYEICIREKKCIDNPKRVI